MLLDVLLAFGLILATLSQLRPDGLPVGPGEICLGFWIFLMLWREVHRLGPPLTPPLAKLLTFWLVFAIAQSLGTMTAYVIGDRHDSHLFMHDVLAYPLLAAVSCLSVVEPGAGLRLRRVAWLVVAFGTVILGLQVAQIWMDIDTPGITLWYWERFRGWSANPNQLAMLCAALGLLSLYLADTATGFGKKVAALACAVLPVYVGRLSMSDTFAIILVGSIPLFAALKVWSWFSSERRRLTIRAAFAWLVILTVPVTVVAGGIFLPSIKAGVEDLARDMAKGNEADSAQTAAIRFHSWREALRRGFDSGMLGLGPGPHIDIPFTLIEGRMNPSADPKDIDHPKVNGTPNFEAHNTLLDLFTQCGLIGVLSVVWLAGISMLGTIRAKLDGLTTTLCGVGVFSIFHLIVRHPIFWFIMSLSLVAADAARRRSNRGIWMDRDERCARTSNTRNRTMSVAR
jgi:hypothetical protein